MNHIKSLVTSFFLLATLVCIGQKAMPALKPSIAANDFVKSLTVEQMALVSKSYADTQRTNWDFVPRTDRTGLVMRDMSDAQVEKFYRLVVATGGEETLLKVKNAAWLENVLRGVEGRPEGDAYRDPKKYFVQIFGLNQKDSEWGWKLEGHHICLNYVIKNDQIVSASPSVYCSNPAVVLDGPDKGRQILSKELDLANTLMNSFSPDQKVKAIITAETPKEIFTYKERSSTVNTPGGLSYDQMNPKQQQDLKALVTYYVSRSSKFFVKDMMDRIAKNGWSNVRFIWAGSEDTTPGHTHYYSVQSPEFLIEYDNYQNKGNHVHSIFRDVKNDFGDGLAAHYIKEH